MVTAYVGLGSNLAEPGKQVERALRELNAIPQTRLAVCSRLYRTAPWGGIAQPDFINAVAALETTLDPHDLMRSLLDIEQRSGRCRDGERNGPRVLDLDLLLYGGLCNTDAELQVPHPRLHQRAFVLVPLAEIAPDLIVPGRGTVRNLLAEVDAAQSVALAEAMT